MIDTILLDLDNTLLDFTSAQNHAMIQTLQSLDIEPEEEILCCYDQINQSLWKQLEQQKITRPELKIRRFEQLFSRFHLSADPARAQALYEYHLAHRADCYPDAEALLQILKKTYRMYAVTNGTAIVQHTRMELSGLLPYFDGLFISEEIGIDKPAKAYFDTCFAKIPCFNRKNTILIGDSLSSDIAGAEQAGLKSIWFHPGKEEIEHPASARAHSLMEIPGILEKMNAPFH